MARLGQNSNALALRVQAAWGAGAIRAKAGPAGPREPRFSAMRAFERSWPARDRAECRPDGSVAAARPLRSLDLAAGLPG